MRSVLPQPDRVRGIPEPGGARGIKMAVLGFGAAVVTLNAMVAVPLLAGGSQKPEDGRAVYARNCALCHGRRLEGGMGPSLAHEGARRSLDWIVEQIRNPGAHKKGSEMPSAADLHLSESQVDAVAKLLFEKK